MKYATSPMKIYIAALYSQRNEMLVVAEKLREAGHEVTSRWIKGAEPGKTPTQAAMECAADVDYADTLLIFSLPHGTLYKGGGRQFEMGYAYGTGKTIVIIGEKGEHVFHHLPSMWHYNTLKEFIADNPVVFHD